MGLKNIPLPAVVIAHLYKRSLMEEIKPAHIPYIEANGFPPQGSKRILFLLHNPDAQLLPGDQMTFLSGILTACKLPVDDVAVVNLAKIPEPEHKKIADLLHSEIIILFGIELSVLELPFKIPSFQVQTHNQKRYVHVPSLHTLQNDTSQKRKLWQLLKVLFSI